MTRTTKFDHYRSDAETPLTTRGARRLLKLAAFLDALPRQKFDFSCFFQQGEKPPLEALKAGAHRCGTVGCAIGWTPAVFPRLVRWSMKERERWDDKKNEWVEVVEADMPELRDGGEQGFDLAIKFFGISRNDSHFLFDPSWADEYNDNGVAGGRINPLDGAATPKRVARHIRRFVKTNYAGKARFDFSAA